MSRHQRRALVALGVANLVAFGALIALLVRTAPPPNGTFKTSPLPSLRLEACRLRVGRALLDAGQTGLVQTQQDGTILLELQRPWDNPNPRLNADAAVWTALESAAAASRGGCLGFRTIEVRVWIQPPAHSSTCLGGRCPALRATARSDLGDLLLWSSGELDDAELALRLDYAPPPTPPPPRFP